MINPDNRLFCRLDGLTAAKREQQRLSAMADLGLLESGNVPVFEEATQTVAHHLEVPVCILSFMEADQQRFKSAVGLSRLGLMNDLATFRQFPRIESFCTYVVDSQQVLSIADTLTHPAFASSLLTQQYGIRAYMGVPLLSSRGVCLGTLAVMSLTPRVFTDKEIEFLELTARWSMSEYERRYGTRSENPEVATAVPTLAAPSIANQLKVELLSQLTQELRTPLTSVMGMASVLMREIYGPLTVKQKEYLGIIHNSGQYLLSLVDEIVELSGLKDSSQELNLSSVDIEMLCQKAISTLEQAAHRREQQIRLSVEPGRRIWLLDREKVRQMLYHLAFSVIQASNAGSILRLHVSHPSNSLTIALWVSHPWLGEGIPYPEAMAQPSMLPLGAVADSYDAYRIEFEPSLAPELDSGAGLTTTIEATPQTATSPRVDLDPCPPKNLGLLLSQQLAVLHGGQIQIQGTPESGYRYVISLPQIAPANEI